MDNIIIYIDLNGQQVEGYTKDVFDIEPISKKLEAFGCVVVTVNGHDVTELEEASQVEHGGKPLIVICKTDVVHGISILEKRKPFLHFVSFSKMKFMKQKNSIRNFVPLLIHEVK